MVHLYITGSQLWAEVENTQHVLLSEKSKKRFGSILVLYFYIQHILNIQYIFFLTQHTLVLIIIT